MECMDPTTTRLFLLAATNKGIQPAGPLGNKLVPVLWDQLSACVVCFCVCHGTARRCAPASLRSRQPRAPLGGSSTWSAGPACSWQGGGWVGLVAQMWFALGTVGVGALLEFRQQLRLLKARFCVLQPLLLCCCTLCQCLFSRFWKLDGREVDRLEAHRCVTRGGVHMVLGCTHGAGLQHDKP